MCAVLRNANSDRTHCGVQGDGCRLVTTFSCHPGGCRRPEPALKVTTPSPCGFWHEWISSFGSWCISKLCRCVSKTKLCSHRCAQESSPNVHTHKYWSLFVRTLVTPRGSSRFSDGAPREMQEMPEIPWGSLRALLCRCARCFSAVVEPATKTKV